MKFRFFVLILVIASLSGCASLSPKQTQLAVHELVTQVQVAVNKIKESTDASGVLPPLSSAELKVSSQAVEDASGKISLVISASGEKKVTDANSITIVLVPSSITTQGVNKGRGDKIANAVLAAVRGLEGLKGLSLKSLTVVASLEIVKTAEGGVDVELAGVSTKLGGSNALTTGNTLTLTFEKPQPK